ncbi:hypothetical protein B0H66DRAFT_570394 [Apodospora peruviana]|uniref:2EXR domain-containing protein n=1 Tax=Apodospora peruviana TaxID=516989 RepID=A0AAE0HTG3_9PEZI|nr:hypothetical protein B0H66DRAFT_570394 [Apodospora peruviana]
MSAASTNGDYNTFTCFRSLPPELRLLIWKEALAAPCVVATVHRSRARRFRDRFVEERREPNVELSNMRGTSSGSNSSRPVPPFELRFLHEQAAEPPYGPGPYQAGQSCCEARHVMERMMVRPSVFYCNAWYRCCWVNLDTTIVYLRDSSHAIPALWIFAGDQVTARDDKKREGGNKEQFEFKHAALAWDHQSGMCTALHHLKVWPSLSSLTVIQPDSLIAQDGTTAVVTAAGAAQQLLSSLPFGLPPTLLASLKRYAAYHLGPRQADIDFIKQMLVKHKATPRTWSTIAEGGPRLHLVSAPRGTPHQRHERHLNTRF